MKILKDGVKPGDIPSSLSERLSLHLNKQALAAQGVELDKKYFDMAAKIID